jgi:hypothetical protein
MGAGRRHRPDEVHGRIDAQPEPRFDGGRDFADFAIPNIPYTVPYPDSMVQLPVTPGSDANGRWNQRYVFRWFDTVTPVHSFIYGAQAGMVNLWYNQKYGGNAGLNWQYGDQFSNVPNLSFNVWPPANQTRPTDLWMNGGANRAWSWMGAGYGPDPSPGYTSYPLPVSPD